uniref:Uncharacterized protein n=1 Tax=Arundo donax TaxID=35708 RepID=A0A0A9AEI1_ARUDO
MATPPLAGELQRHPCHGLTGVNLTQAALCCGPHMGRTRIFVTFCISIE